MKQAEKFRCSSLGKLMGGLPKPLTERQTETLNDLMLRFEKAEKPLTPTQLKTLGSLMAKRDAKATLNTTAAKYLDRILWENETGRTNTLKNKYLDKGIIVEEKSLTLYSEVYNNMLIKNTERKSNDYIIGTCDNADGKIRDIKSSWDFSTFPVQSETIPNSDYEWQLDGYMWLWGMDEAELIYCLIDTPSRLIDDELRRLDWKHNIFSTSGDVRDEAIPFVIETVTNHIYTRQGLEEYCLQSTNVYVEWFKDFKELPKKARCKVYDYALDKARIEQIKEMVILSREYLEKNRYELISV